MSNEQADYYAPKGAALLLVRLAIVLLALLFLFLLVTLLWHSHIALAHLVVLAALVALYRPVWCLYVLALIFPLFGNNPGGKHALYFIDLMVMVVVLRWLIPLAFEREPRLRKTPFDLPVCFFVFISALSIVPLSYDIWDEYLFFGKLIPFVKEVYTTYATTLRWSLRAFLDLVLAVLLFYYLVNNLREPRHARNLLRCFLISMFAALFIGILDYHNVLSLEFYRPLNTYILQFGYKRLQSFFWHSGWFAEYVTMLAPFYVAALLFAAKKRRWLALLPLYIVLHGLLFTYARGGWLTFLVTMAFLVALGISGFARLLQNKKFWLIALGVALICGAAIVGGMSYLHSIKHPLYQRVFNVFNYRDRLHIWDAALTMYAKYPVFGIGLGDHYVRHTVEFSPPHPFSFNDKVAAHNVYLQVLVERGPFALLAFVFIVCIGFYWGLNSFRRCSRDDARRKFVAGALASLLAFAVYGIFQDMFYVRVIELLFWMLLGILFFFIQTDIVRARITRTRGERWLIVAAILILLAARAQHPRFKDLHLKTIYKDERWICGKRITYLHAEVSKPVVKMKILIRNPDIAQRPVTLRISANGIPISSSTYTDYEPHEQIVYLPDYLGQRVELRFEVDRTWQLREWGRENFLYNFGPSIRIPLETEEFLVGQWGFYPPEAGAGQVKRWTQHRAALRLQARGKTLVLSLLAQNPDLAQKPLTVKLFINSALARSIELREKDKWHEARLDVPLKQGEWFVLGIIPQRTWRPSQIGYDDSRELGVFVAEPRWE